MPDTADSPQPDEAQPPQQDLPDVPRAEDGQGEEEGVHPLHTDARPQGRDRHGVTGGSHDRPDWENLHRMLDVPLNLTVELGSTEMPLAEVLKLDAGAVITIDRLPGEPIDLLINGRPFARGEVVVINDTFGCRITEMVDDADETIQVAREDDPT